MWIIAVLASLVFSLLITLTEWNKFRHNSTALFIETDYRQFSFDKPIITVCPYYNATERVNNFMQQKLSINTKNPEFQYFQDFLHLLMHTNYTNLEKYERFVNQTRIKASDFGAIAVELKNRTTVHAKYRLILTELGVCFTGSNIDFVMNPERKRVPRENLNEQCSAGKTCKLVFEPNSQDTFQHFYVHSRTEIPSSDIKIKGTIDSGNVSSINIYLNEVRSDANVHDLSIESRRCRFTDEPQPDSYYGIYTLNLCATDCRIKAALRYCKCVPFFYMRKPVCDAKGMYCLGKNPEWMEADCKCPDVCSFITLKEHGVPKGQMSFFVFDTQLNILVTCPKIRIIRKVIYSFKDFLVSFGGAVALFLGFSFVICLEFVFIFLQNGVFMIKNGWEWLKNKVSEEKRQKQHKRIRFVEEYY